MGRPPSETSGARLFRSELEEIIEEPAPRLMRSLHYVIIIMALIVVLIASVKEVEIIITCSGRLVTDIAPVVLQPMEQAIIRELKVVVGSRVTKGQVLATMDPTFTQADIRSLSTQEKSLLTQVKGLERELRMLEPGGESVSDPDGSPPDSLYRQRMQQYQSRLRVFDEEILRLKVAIRSTEDDQASLAKQLAVARTLEAMRSVLEQSQAGSKLQSLDAKSMRMRAERDYQNAIDRLTELRHSVDAKLAERQAFRDEWHRQALENLTSARSELTRVREGLVKTQRMSELEVVTAPVDGTVVDVAKLSVGSVLRPAEQLITITPANATLVAEISLNSKDVGYVKPGDEAVVKVDAFPYQRHGLLHGRILWISEESFQAGGSSPQEGNLPMSGHSANAVHQGRMALLGTRLRNMPEGIQLIPGMTLSADIKVGSRSVISYALYPLIRAFGESIREP